MTTTLRTFSTVALLAALLPLAACDRPGGGGEWTGSVTDSAGVQIVSNPGEGIWSEEDRWRVVEELAIGVASGNPELEFGLIAGVDVDDQGRIFVLDQQASRVRVFSPEGDFLHAFGRPGQGPDELSQAAGALLIDREGNLLVPDLLNQRLARFTPEGEALASVPLDVSQGFPVIWVVDGERTIYQQVRRIAIPGMPGAPDPEADLILVRNPEGQVTDTVARLRTGETLQSGAGGITGIRMLAPEPLWTVLEDGRLVEGINSEYSLSVRGPDGEVRTILRRAATTRPVTPSDEERLRGMFAGAFEDGGVPAAAVQQMLDMIEFHHEWPVLAALFGGPSQSLWVQRIATDITFDELSPAALQELEFGSREWDVFDADGRYLGVVAFPEHVTPRRTVGDHIYAIRQDELGVQRVVRMRVEGSSP